MFYNNTFYWKGNRLSWRLSYEYSYIFETNRTFGDTEWSQFAVNGIVDSGIVSEGRNGNLKTTFSNSTQTTLN